MHVKMFELDITNIFLYFNFLHIEHSSMVATFTSNFAVAIIQMIVIFKKILK